MSQKSPFAWYPIAIRDIGVREIKGPEQNNSRILEYFQSTSLRATTDEIPWCAAFVNFCLTQAGYKGTHSARARSFLTWGKGLKDPVLGCIVILARGTNRAQGHVGFYAGRSLETGFIKILGGNQGDAVSIVEFHKGRVLAYRAPRDFKIIS